ncbi:MAG TPA: hypothetical protein VHE80_09580, partial [Acidimicrobiales bacterium]|nr:hypothetical protein [Acidimicrobiales bacterium]
MALLAAGCGRHDHDTDSTTASAERATTSTVVSPPTTPAVPPPTAEAPRAAVPRRDRPPARAATGPASAPEPGSSRSVTFTAPGRYTYASTGTFTDPLGGTRPRQGQVVLTVDPPQGRDQRSIREGDDLTTEQVFRLEDDGAYLVSLSQTFMGVRKDFRFD